MAGFNATMSLPQDPSVHTKETAQVDPRQLLGALSNSTVEAALDRIGEEQSGGDALQEALLASLEKSADRKPMSGVHNPDKLRELLASQSDEPFARESLLAQPALILEATAIETPQGLDGARRSPNIGPTGADWFEEPEVSPLNLGGAHDSDEVVDSIADGEYLPARSNASMILVMVAALLVGGGIVFVLINGSTEETSAGATDESAAATKQDTASGEGRTSETDAAVGPDDSLAAGVRADALDDVPKAAHPQLVLLQTGCTKGASVGVCAGTHKEATTVERTSNPVSPNPTDPAIGPDDGGSFDSLLKRGKRARSLGNHQEALRYYTDAVELKPRNAEANAGLGWANLNLGNSAKAISDFEEAID